MISYSNLTIKIIKRETKERSEIGRGNGGELIIEKVRKGVRMSSSSILS